MNTPFILRGGLALSAFRIKALMSRLTAAIPGITALEARFTYFLNTDATPTGAVLNHALALLDADTESLPEDGFYVTPRKGTISPWSSKATDIFHNCDLKMIHRVERGIHYRVLKGNSPLTGTDRDTAYTILHDRMTEGTYTDIADLFHQQEPAPLVTVDIITGGRAALEEANTAMGLALSDDEIEYLYSSYSAIKRNPTDVELVMFGQVNSEHCRHKIFNADWIIDGKKMDRSLFSMIRNTHEKHPEGTLVAYCDNSSVMEGFTCERFAASPQQHNTYTTKVEQTDILMKVETHNHPTAISPYPGAATGVGGEIRDEAATGTSGKTKAGLNGYIVSNLQIPQYRMPWEIDHGIHPRRLASPLDIMLEGPIGGARFGNEFGRPQLCGFFRTFEEEVAGKNRGYHKPIMIAGGMGNLRREHTLKDPIPAESLIIQLGGPAMRIGLGGGAASSMATGSNKENLDFNSVQRDNAEVERRCQEVFDACGSIGTDNPILSVHDIGAGGLSNGCPELVEATGGHFELRKINNEEPSMSPMEIWCNESQERYVLAIAPENLDRFMELCTRERCPVAIVGKATDDHHLTLHDAHFDNNPIDMEMKLLLGKPPKMLRDVVHAPDTLTPLFTDDIDIAEAAERVLAMPSVANKTFLITITDRSITGQVARDQMVGPYQTPIADVAVTATSHSTTTGEAMAIGERTPVALISGPASGRMAVGEAITNISAASIGPIGNIKLSANWMSACGEPNEDAALFDTVKTVGMELCPTLGISIPVGKDSLSMRTVWETPEGKDMKQIAPLSLIISAFAPVLDVRKTVTPDLKATDATLFLIDLGHKKNRLGGSVLAQAYNRTGDVCPDLDTPADLKNFYNAVQELLAAQAITAYHDRSDGGLFACITEMCIAGRRGATITIDALGADTLAALFTEELGAVFQITSENEQTFKTILAKHSLTDLTVTVGTTTKNNTLTITTGSQEIYSNTITKLNRTWSELTYHMQTLRDNPTCAQTEYDALLDTKNPGMQFDLSYVPEAPFALSSKARPKMAILREQGINGQIEMAAAFDKAGFVCTDIHMTDLFTGRVDLKDFVGLVACGGFSYGDVLGAGAGWAKSILYNEKLLQMFTRFFNRPETFSLGVCNGCQMLSQLKEIIPGANHWPRFEKNISEQFEARYVTLQIAESPSVLFKGMAGSRIPIPVAHGEGRVDFSTTGSMDETVQKGLISARYVDNYGNPTEQYPFNPNGSADGITALTTTDGRVTIMMPHPERAFRGLQLSYAPEGMFNEEGPWLQMFRNARSFIG